MDYLSHGLYAALWVSFGLGHSLLANPGAKQRMAFLGRWSRVTYNGIAAVHITVVLAVGGLLLGDSPLFAPPWPVTALQLTMAALGVVLLAWASVYYDLGRLSGLHQLRAPEDAEDEPLRLDGPHRYLRHPLYAAGVVLLWGLALSPFGLATALWGTLYLVIGSRSEERRLQVRYGDAYTAYRRRIPGFIPAPLLGRAPLPPVPP